MATTKTEFLGYLPQGTQLFEYVIERVLGHGGFGITYLAHDTLLDKSVAIKEYLPTDLAMRAGLPQVVLRAPDMREAFIWGREQFLKEARTLARFAHPNLITVHRFFEANDTAYFVMEYAQGQTLAQILKRESVLPEDRLLAIVLPVLAGLEQVHKAGVLHRDIKPDNIMLRADGNPVLIDFGAARLTLGSKTRSILSVLTAGYAPLEQYGSAGSNQGPWTDIYAFGAVTYRAITGKKPADAVNRVHSDPMVPAVEAGKGRYSPKFLAAIDWALAVVPEHRPHSISDWRAALEGEAPPPPGVVAETAPVQSDETTDWGQLAAAAAAQYAEFSGQVPESHADSDSPMRTPISPSVRSLTMAPAAAPHRRTTWIATLVMLGLVMGAFEYVIHREPRAPAVALPRLALPPASPGSTTTAPPDESVEPAPEHLSGKLDEKLSEPPSTKPEPAPAPPPSVAVAPQPAPAEKIAPAPPPVAPPAPVARTEPRAANPEAKAATKPDKKTRAAPAAAPVAESPIAKLKPRSVFRDCAQCPELTVLPAGSFTMGASLDPSTNAWERPAHSVQIRRAFAIARHEVTVGQWHACVNAGGCPGQSVGKEADVPATDVSWDDTQRYVAWLSRTAGRKYRLPTEAEWEYAERAGTSSSRYWGEDRREQCRFANGADQSAKGVVEKGLRVAECDDHVARLAAVGSFLPNDFGLYDMVGNVWEWVQDCWHDSYSDAPRNGSAIDAANCPTRVIRGGSWRTKPESLRSFSRGLSTPDHRGDDTGFRVVAD